MAEEAKKYPAANIVYKTDDGKLENVGALWNRQSILFGGELNLAKLRDLQGDKLSVMVLVNTPKAEPPRPVARKAAAPRQAARAPK